MAKPPWLFYNDLMLLFSRSARGGIFMKKFLLLIVSVLLFYLMFGKNEKQYRPGSYEEMER